MGRSGKTFQEWGEGISNDRNPKAQGGAGGEREGHEAGLRR